MGRFQNKYVIGLTGNIATGKSTVRQMLQHLGAYTIDADSLAHQVMMPGAPAYKSVVATFGQFIVGPDGRIDRSILGKIVFGNPAALKKLEDITHPIIRQGIMALITRAQQRVIVIEAIKLLDGDLANMVDSVWVVDASPITQYRRLIEKRKMSEADAKQRILAQQAQAEKLKRANVVIKNDGSVEDTWKQVQIAFNDVRKQLMSAASPQPAAQTTSAAQPPTRELNDPTPAEEVATAVVGVVVKRGMPNNAADIAEFISQFRQQPLTREDVMMAFGLKSFLIGQTPDGKVISVVGWTVENLVTRIDEFYISPQTPIKPIVKAMVSAVESASQELQSEVSFYFLPKDTPAALISAFQENGYNHITVGEIKIPVWREAVDETTRGKDYQVLWKQLRQDRVLQPI
ncbi:dephospho-CoA kinase [Aggregatilineales bacterium SYSU G02658]